MAIRDLRIDGQPENNTGVKKLRVGVLGMGFMGGTHTQAWQRVKATFNLPVDIEMKALFDMSDDSLALNGARYQFERTTKDWRDVCAADDIDVVSICTPNFAHLEATEMALAHGKHVWCEKPMATSIAVDQINPPRNGALPWRHIFVCFPRFFCPPLCDQFVRDF